MALVNFLTPLDYPSLTPLFFHGLPTVPCSLGNKARQRTTLVASPRKGVCRGGVGGHNQIQTRPSGNMHFISLTLETNIHF